MRLRLTSLLSLAALVAPVAGAQGALPNSTIRGRLAGLPANPLLADVFAVDTRGVIAAGVELGPTGSFRMAVPSGSYVLIGSAASPGGQEFLGGTPPVRARPHKRSTIGGRLKQVKASSAAAPPPPLAHGAIASVESISVIDNGASTELGGADLRAHVINLLLNLCSGAGTVLVDTSPRFVAFAKQELALSRAHRLSTPFDYKPLKPQFVISGKAEVTRGPAAPPNNIGLTVELLATSLTGGPGARGFDEIPPAATEISTGALLATVDVATERFAKAACGNSGLS